MISKHEARSIIRKAVSRVPEGEEIRHLNIMPMMDMMTILLVAMIFQSATASAMEVSVVDLPFSQSHETFPRVCNDADHCQRGDLGRGKSCRLRKKWRCGCF